MAETTGIEWCDHTFNPWRGCTHCYAETLSKRNPAVLGELGPNGTRVVASDAAWKEPLRWDRRAKAAGERRKVFCASLADVMEDRPELHLERERLWGLIQNCHNLDWLILTKRPENFSRFLPWSLAGDAVKREGVVWPHVWLGVSVEDQLRADERIPLLLKTPAAVRFLSCEPLLGPVDLTRLCFADGSGWRNCLDGRLTTKCTADTGQEFWAETEKPIMPRIDWVIVGGESGPRARPMHRDWAISLRDQCEIAGVPFFFKQWGAWIPAGQVAGAGRYLDGKEHSEFPAV